MSYNLPGLAGISAFSGPEPVYGGTGKTETAALWDRQLAGEQNRPALLAEQNKMNRFDTIFPWLQGQLGNWQSKMATAGGSSGKSPEITVGGIFNPQQVQQQVNAARSGNDQAASGQMARQGDQLAGQGFGANSPLLAALRGQTQAANLGTNTANERDIRMNAAQQNSQQLLATQQAREAQFASRQKESIERSRPYFSTYSSLLSSLAGLV